MDCPTWSKDEGKYVFEQKQDGIVKLTPFESSLISKVINYYIEKNKSKKKFSEYEEKSLELLQEKVLGANFTK